MSWFRWYEGTRHNKKYRYLSSDGKVLFATLMELSSETQSNVSWNGYIRFTETELYTDEQLADESRLPVQVVRPCLEAMKKVQFIEETEQGIRILKWRERQYKTDSSTDRVRKYREKNRDSNGDETLQKRNETVSVTPPEQSTEQSTDINTSPRKRARDLPPYTDDFETFWSFYPRPKEKKPAYTQWLTVLKNGAYPDDVIIACKHYLAACKGKEEQFIKHPASFLGKDRWMEYLTPQPSPSSSTSPSWVRPASRLIQDPGFGDRFV